MGRVVTAAPHLMLVVRDGRPVAVPDPRFRTRDTESAGSDLDTEPAEPARKYTEPDDFAEEYESAFGLGEIVMAILMAGAAAVFGGHVALAIHDGTGAWAVFGGPY